MSTLNAAFDEIARHLGVERIGVDRADREDQPALGPGAEVEETTLGGDDDQASREDAREQRGDHLARE